MKKRLVRTSKFLSLVLRHRPEVIGLELDAAGWAEVPELIRLAREHGRELSEALIREVVETIDKRRFSLSDDGSRIRARQGHSLTVDLGLEPVTPPEMLYHGTAKRFLDSIRRQGLRKGKRHHVHLSVDEATAYKVVNLYEALDFEGVDDEVVETNKELLTIAMGLPEES